MPTSDPYLERRASVRYSCRSDARLCFPPPPGHEACVRATARDISTGGISLIVSQWFGQGTLVRIELQNGTRDAVRQINACVMHSTLLPDGQWFVGCAFLERLSPEDMGPFI